MNYSYRAYGLVLASSVRIAGLDALPDVPLRVDVRFENGPAPDWVAASRALPESSILHRQHAEGATLPAFVLTSLGENGFELKYADGTCFVVSNDGNRAWGECVPPLTTEDLATYLLGPIMGFILRLKRRTCLHASAVQIGGRGVAFAGDTGSGKSTTAAALSLRGMAVCGEDIVPLEESSGGFDIVPGYPRVCLWPDSVRMLLDSPDALPLLTPTWDKRYLPLDGTRARFASDNLPLGLVYLFGVRTDSERAPFIKELSRKEALLELVRNTYMSWLPDAEQRAREFDVLARLVDSVPVLRIVPHTDPNRIGALCDLIAEQVHAVSVKR